jgi:hypothetical protein
MKTRMILLVLLVVILTAAVPVLAKAEVLIAPPNQSQLDPRVSLNNYYIGIHGPDGSCQTMQLFASSYDEAIKVVKQARCDFCALDDMTAYFTSTGADVIAQASKTCPLR